LHYLPGVCREGLVKNGDHLNRKTEGLTARREMSRQDKIKLTANFKQIMLKIGWA